MTKQETCLPTGLRFQQAWPPRIPAAGVADRIVAVRELILAHHALVNHFPTARSVIARFAALHAARPAT